MICHDNDDGLRPPHIWHTALLSQNREGHERAGFSGHSSECLRSGIDVVRDSSHTTPLFIDPKIGNPLLLRTLCLHTNVPIATRLDDADFVLLSGNRFSYDLMALSCGSEVEPEKSTTVIVEVEGMHDGPCLKLTGPGIKTHRIISPRLPGSVRDYLCNRPHAFPTGLDFLFTSGKKLFAIPRSTHVEEC